MKRSWIIIGAVALAIVIGGATIWVGSGHARIPLILVPFVALNRALDPEEVATVGEPLGDDTQAYTHPVSEQFGKEELRKAFELLNSDSFQAPLAKYNCGDTVPRFKFQVVLYRTSRAHAGARRVEWRYSPAIDHAGRGRCLSSGLSYLVKKAFAKIDPSPSAASHDRTTREPHCDCSKRDSKEEWVTYPGPDEKLW
jgi:hypothetical protein